MSRVRSLKRRQSRFGKRGNDSARGMPDASPMPLRSPALLRGSTRTGYAGMNPDSVSPSPTPPRIPNISGYPADLSPSPLPPRSEISPSASRPRLPIAGYAPGHQYSTMSTQSSPRLTSSLSTSMTDSYTTILDDAPLASMLSGAEYGADDDMLAALGGAGTVTTSAQGPPHHSSSETSSEPATPPTPRQRARPSNDVTLNEEWQASCEAYAEMTAQTALHVYDRIANLSKRFLATAKRYGAVIVSELHLPPEEKLIKPSALGGVIGGEKVGPIAWRFC